MPEIEIGPDFQMALDHIDGNRKSAFITGVAGTGKSTLLQHFRETANRAVVVLAPTGIAAVNVHGQTIHSFFRLPPRVIEPEDITPSRDPSLYQNLETVVIDEISMVRVDLMDAIDRSLRINRRRPGEPFGGAQIVFFGDPHQLPPVVDDGIHEYLENRYGGVYFFHAPGVREARLRLIELQEHYRHRDAHFISLLDAIRNNQLDEATLLDLNQQVREDFEPSERDGYVTLTPCRLNASCTRATSTLAVLTPVTRPVVQGHRRRREGCRRRRAPGRRMGCGSSAPWSG